jgi:drug/metabolite transporter (DMT)-like permease
MTEQRQSGGVPDTVTLTAFLIAVVIGGSNFVGVRFSNRELEPFFGAGVRFSIAAVLLLGWMVFRRIRFPRGRVLKATILYGVLSFTVTYALAYYALVELSAGAAAVVFGATPLVTLVLAAAHGIEHFTTRGMVGSLLAVVGIVILADPRAGEGLPLLPLLAVIGAAFAAGESTVILKIVPPEHAVATNGVAMAVGAPLLLLLSALVGETWLVPEEAATWTALAYLSVIGSVGLFGLLLFTLGRWTASAVAYMTALFPVVAMVVGALVADEPITLNGAIGGAVVIVAVYVGALRRGSKAPATLRS